MEESDKVFGDLVKAARDLLGWTQADLAFMAGLSTVTTSRIERGVIRSKEVQEKVLQTLETAGIVVVRGRNRRGVFLRRPAADPAAADPDPAVPDQP